MKNLILSLLSVLAFLPTFSFAQINLSAAIANKVAENEKRDKNAVCFQSDGGGDKSCNSSCKVAGRTYGGSWACENSSDKAKRERALKCPQGGIKEFHKCLCDCNDEPNFNYKMICSPLSGGTVGSAIESCKTSCGKHGLTFNKQGLSVGQATIELTTHSSKQVQGAPNCEKELNLPQAVICFCDKK